MIKLLVGVFIGAALVVLDASAVSAQSLRIEPLIINEQIQPAEKKKGFVDISNPTNQTLQLVTSVQAFRQKDNNGGLEFYDNEQVTAGLIPDLSEIELGPREVVRMYYLVDGTKLPQGDVFAAIFVSTKPDQERAGVAQAVKLGTIFTLVNGTPGPRQAVITQLNVPAFQFGDSISGAYTIKNTADPNTTTGFYPEVVLQLAPFGNEQKVRSSLVMGGVERSMGFSFDDSRFGLYRLSAQFGDSEQSTYVFVMTGVWKFIVPGIVFVGLVIGAFLYKRRHRRSYYKLVK